MGASSLPWKSSKKSLRVIHNRVLLLVVHFGWQLGAGSWRRRCRRCRRFSIGGRGGFRIMLRGKTIFPARVSLLKLGVAFPTGLRWLLGLPSTEGQSRGTRRWAGLAKGHCVTFHPVNSLFWAFRKNFQWGIQKQRELERKAPLWCEVSWRERNLQMIRINCWFYKKLYNLNLY